MCNLNATLCRKRVILCVLVVAGIANDSRAAAACADEPAPQNEHRITDAMEFVAGAASAFAVHEAGHLVFDVIFDASPYLKSVHFGPLPFFAIAHERALSPRREFAVSSAGFWTQQATSEWLLTRRPHLRDEHAPFAKGVFAFDVLTSVGYGIVAFARAGPVERDTRGIGAGVRIDERAIGAIVIAPALLDGYRYLNPDSRWARWASRAVKVGSVLLVVR